MITRVGYIGGFWATNIGNSFYNLGALYLLKKIYGEENVFFIPDPPQWHWPDVTNDYKIISNLDLDLFIISGPCFSSEMIKVYKATFDILNKKGKRLAFLSVGAARYNIKDAKIVSEFLNKYNIDYVISRDETTFDLYKNLLKTKMHNGLCTSMFLNDAVQVPKLEDNYVVANFSTFREPIIYKKEDNWVIKYSYFKALQNSIEGNKIIRTNNQPFTRRSRFINTKYLTYFKKNTYYSDLPFGYLSIIKGASYVFSDRVHTCAAALIFGKKTMYVKNSKRSNDKRNHLFLRLGVTDIYNKPTLLNQDFITSEKELMINFMKNNII